MKLLWLFVLIAIAAATSGCSLTSSEPNVESTDSFVQKQLGQRRI